MTTNNDFEIALKSLLKNEGGYIFDNTDKGGETYCGISRNNFPNWIGWNRIDHYKTSNHFSELLKADLILEINVSDFYKNEFWFPLQCHYMPDDIAYELFEMAVNIGMTKAISMLQKILNLLNRNESLYEDILVDGIFGRITLATLRTSLEHNDAKLFLNLLNILQGSFYVELMLNNPVYEKYIGWFNRVNIINK